MAQIPIMHYVIFFTLLILLVAYIYGYWQKHISNALKESDGVLESIKRHITWLFSVAYIIGFILEVVDIHISATIMGTMAAVVFATVGGSIAEKIAMKKISTPDVSTPETTAP